MQSDLLSVILSHIERPEDFVRCSVVSKGWAATVLQARPVCLKVHHLRDDDHDYDKDDGACKWVHAMNA